MKKQRRCALALASCGLLAGAAGAGDHAMRAAEHTARLALAGAAPGAGPGVEIINRRITPVGEGLVITWEQRAPGGAAEAWFAISRDGARVDRIARTENLIRLRYASFDPLGFVPGVDERLKAPTGADVCIVQFVSQPLAQYRDDIRALGGSVERFLADNAYIVRMDPAARAAVGGLPYVRWIGAFHPAYKLDEPILQAIALGAPGDLTAPKRYSIMMLREGAGSLDPVARRIRAMGARIDALSPQTGRLEATLTLEQVLEVARANETLFIDEWGPVGPDMDIVRMYHGTDYVEGLTGFSGEGVRGEILDVGVEVDHPEFSHQTPILHGPVGTALHGTAVAGILFAQGLDPKARGIIPDGQMIIAEFFGADRYAATAELVDPAGPYRAVFQNSSAGSPRTSAYTSISAEMDRILFDHDLAVCQSHSDAGVAIARPEAWAKNIISVGGFLHNDTLTRADDRHGSLASTGPAADGRIKPDLSSFYDHIYTVGSAGGHAEFGGASAATAIGSGHLGLLHQMWHEGVFPGYPRGGPGATVFDSRPHMTTAKALLINTASAYPIGFADFTRLNQGWGPPDVRRLYDERDLLFIVDQEDVIENLDVRAYEVAVAPGETRLKITMVYPDPPGAPASAQHRINDLSVRAISPGGDIYWGNAGLLTGDWSTPGGTENHIDTVENVFIQDPAPGAWRIEVIASEINEDGHPATPELDAVYSLVINGGRVTGDCYADCDGSGALDFFDFLCFQNAFAAGEPYADCDGSGALDFFDFLCFQNAFAAGCR
ncbi:MAG: S8 family serine peptidase [Phycisphaerales bacterium JB039]